MTEKITSNHHLVPLSKIKTKFGMNGSCCINVKKRDVHESKLVYKCLPYPTGLVSGKLMQNVEEPVEVYGPVR